ncbi:hypothetical protein LGH83_04495 [Lichenihabitans sp. PAMC28606]|uniref:hypothetical protein n=1 Tax=Lichenihabitans sp. PAMC28606 TaxID=2880932 RepID=UPI001D0A8643|nr:hypothetical protein [Lichenihabitans sp. PAMC28606]UDL95486.1 hypothetical protein LGH83_04495 [Lichenihabitans sp. PAMC28606]
MVVRSEMPEASAGRTSSPAPVTGVPTDKTSRAAFRQFMEARQKTSSKGRTPLNTRGERPILPTPERLVKSDRPKKTSAGYYRAPAPIERLRNSGKLDPHPRINEAMYTASQTLQLSFHNAGLTESIKSQDLTGTGGGGSSAASHMPLNEFALHHRQKYLTACKRMGWYEPYPLRGCGRLVVDVICHEMSIEDAGSRYFPGSRNATAIAAANDRLREGLFMLAVHWKLI